MLDIQHINVVSTKLNVVYTTYKYVYPSLKVVYTTLNVGFPTYKRRISSIKMSYNPLFYIVFNQHHVKQDVGNTSFSNIKENQDVGMCILHRFDWLFQLLRCWKNGENVGR